ncbi:MAG TPA: DMT family transporter [Candidatus Bilophila faecipullorum]|uniref:DMT family transporter n=2 Tax=Bilophila TaxID=35832 RepID=A0A9D1R1L1_9BACT|nr:DMT family transporter [uncultured Bilophila sp.]HIW78412.1 DMT family transporter [Candidatus Bilophila faecipullorum]
MNDLARLRERQEVRFAKKGLALALFSGMIWSLDGLALGKGLAERPFDAPALWLFAPLLAAGLHDFFAACLCLAVNCTQGRGREIIRTLFSKPGRLCILGALLGSPLGMGGFLMGLSLAGPAYVLPITSLYPAIAALLALVFLKERISRRAWLGLTLCVVGAVAIGYTPPESAGGGAFYLGIAFAFLAAFGWAAEGVCVTSGMDFIEPAVALNIYQIVSSLLYALIIVPAALLHLSLGGYDITGLAGRAFTSSGLPFFAVAGVIGCITYLCWYKAMNMTGVSRAMALNITYALWGVVFSALFTDAEITRSLVIGAAAIFTGMCLVIGNPRDIVNLRNVQ